MEDSADKGLGNGENAENKSIHSGSTEGAASDHNLPVVWSPKLDATDDIEQDLVEVPFGFGDEPPPHEEFPAGDAAAESTTAASSDAQPSRSSRFMLLAASVSLAAAIGSFAATLAAIGIGHGSAASPVAQSTAGIADNSSVTKALKDQIAQLNAVKSSLDSATHLTSAQLNSISERLEKVEHAQNDPAQLAHLAESVDRLTKSNASAPEVTGSISPQSQGATAATPASTEPKINDHVLEDWVLEDVHGERALVASRYGGEFLVMPGSMLPGPGHVDAVKRQNGQWVVLTTHGVITEGH